MKPFFIILILFVIVAIINSIRFSIYKKKFMKEHQLCPECGEKLVYELFDIETDSRDSKIGKTHFSHGVKYYPVMTCPKCYYTIKLTNE